MSEPLTVPYFEGGCVLHKTHVPRPLELHKHHVYPVGIARENGWPTVLETVLVCPTGHVNVHNHIARLLKGGAIPGRHGKTVEYAEKAVEWVRGHA